MSKLYIIEYKAFQPITEMNILGLEPIIKKDDATGVLITMIKKDCENNNVSLSIIVENPNNVGNIITGNLEIPFPIENNVKSQIVKINNVIEFILSTKLINSQESIKDGASLVASSNVKDIKDVKDGSNAKDESFITVSRKTFADRVRGGELVIQSKINTYKETNYQSKVNNNIVSDLDINLKKIINSKRDVINSERCFRYHEKSNCLIMMSYKKCDVCKQCKNMIAICK